MNDMSAKLQELNERAERVDALLNSIIHQAIMTPESSDVQEKMNSWPHAFHIAFDPPWRELDTMPVLNNLAGISEHNGFLPRQIVGFARGIIDGAYVLAIGFGHKA